MAKIAMRVRVSELNLTEEVSGKGSGLIVTDSTAMALVEVDSLSKTGDLLVAAWTMLNALARTRSKTTCAE